MAESFLLDAVDKLRADNDGSYRAKLIQRLEQYRDEFSSSKQGLLPPDEYDLAEAMEEAINAGLNLVREFGPVESSADAAEVPQKEQEESAVNTIINC